MKVPAALLIFLFSTVAPGFGGEQVPKLSHERSCVYFATAADASNENASPVAAVDWSTRTVVGWFKFSDGSVSKLQKTSKRLSTMGIMHSEFHLAGSKIWVDLDCKPLESGTDESDDHSGSYEFTCKTKVVSPSPNVRLIKNEIYGTCFFPDNP